MSEREPRRAAQILVDQLIIQQVRDIFCVPGESYLAVLDALHDANIRVTICRQEGGAGMMADAAGRLTGRPGICFVTRGPGAMNASPAIHIAHQDSIPLILFVGQIERSARERGAFQELDYRAVFASMTKWTTEIDDAARIPEIISRAFHIAMSGRPGPVVIALPEDMLVEMACVTDAPFVNPVEAHPSLSQMAQLQKRLWAARSPIAIVGGTGWSQQAVDRIVRFSEAFDLPVAVSFRRQMLFPATHPNFVDNLGIGPNPALLKRFREADLILAIGARLGEMPSQGYSLLDIPGAGDRLVHVHGGAEELGRVYAPSLAINAGMEAFAAAVQTLQPPPIIPWAGEAAKAHAEYLVWSTPPKAIKGQLQLGVIMEYLRDTLPDDAILCNGAGNYATWLHRFYRFRRFGTQAAPTSGSMGYGVPAAVGAKRLYPERTVIAFAGDGCFLMNGQEFATAVQYELPIVVIIIDNGMYGTIRMHQEREYPGRVSATSLKNPDFAAYARAFGGHGECVEKTDEFVPAFERAMASGKPAILHLLLDPEVITPTTTIEQIRNRPR
ncbi:IlvB Thiamine pyrophosphate-requiring enzymes [acetolactate synthase, pyruvate dehydrogenase (cytochrome), glyoxylate carboligase, phosphonopyruvate decarboxylase] [Rhabdaerophilaceae bacterium]